jgi:hypothetical protein
MTFQEVPENEIYNEFHLQNAEDIGVAWNGRRIWICINGVSLFRAKIMDGQFMIEFNPPPTFDEEPEDNMTDVEADADTLKSIGWGTDEDYGGTDERY